MNPPILMVKTADLDTAISAVPSARWCEWLGADGPLEIRGTVRLGPGRLVRLVDQHDGHEEGNEYIACVGWDPDADPIAVVQTGSGRLVLADALQNPAVRDALYSFALRGSAESGDDIRMEPSNTSERPPGRIPASRLGESTSRGRTIEYENTAVFELFTRLTPEEPADLTVARHLTQIHFPHVEPLMAVVTLKDLETNAKLFLGMLTGIFEKPVSARQAFRSELARTSGMLTDRARALGRDLSSLHRALSADGAAQRFSVRATDDTDVSRWRDRLSRSATEACDQLLRVSADRELASRLPEVRSLSDQLADKVRGAAGSRAWIHGELDLDRIHRLADGRFVFKGFSAVSVYESPVFDVATLIRSMSRAVDRFELEENEKRSLEREVRAALLNGYFGDDWDSELLPPTPHRLLALLQLFELEIAFRQLSSALSQKDDVDAAVYGARSTLDGRRR